MNSKHFIRTSNTDTAIALRREGLTELPMDGKYFVFINDPKKENFSSNVKQRDLIYSNKLSI